MFKISNVIPERNIAADGVYAYDMGVNPLSVVLINLKPLNDTGTLANFANAYRIAAAMNRCTLMHRGQAVQSYRGEDLLAFNFFRWGMTPFEPNGHNVDNERRCITVPMILGRYPFSPTSCYPHTEKGTLTLELDLDIADTGYDTLNISVDCIELPDAKPKEFEKRVQQSLTFNATGDSDMFMPVGNLIRGFLLYGTTSFTGAVPAPTWGKLSVLLDNFEAGFRGMSYETLQTLFTLYGRHGDAGSLEDEHHHTTTVDGNAGTAVATLAGQYITGSAYNNYAFLDYDPDGTDEYVLDATAAKRLTIRSNVGTADAARAYPIEVIPAAAVA